MLPDDPALQDLLMDWPAQRAHRPPDARPKETLMIDWPALLAELARPFPAAALRYRVGAVSKDRRKAQALPYVEPRAYEARLDELAPGAWNVAFEPWGEGRLICRLTLHGVTRASTGESSDSPAAVAGTAAEAQAFKRACSKFGLGRYLYRQPPQWVAYDDTRKRLLETPAPSASPTVAAAPAGPDGATAPGDVHERLGAARATRMRDALQRLGVPPERQLGLAASVLARDVASLAGLTSEEAQRVWRSSKRRWGLLDRSGTSRNGVLDEDIGQSLPDRV